MELRHFWTTQIQLSLPGIDELYRFESIVDIDDWQDWSENFFLHNGIISFDIDKNSRLNELFLGIRTTANGNISAFGQWENAPGAKQTHSPKSEMND